MGRKLTSCYGMRIAALLLMLFQFFAVPDVSAEVIRQDQAKLAVDEQIPLYIWKDTKVTPKALALVIHGFTLHGTLYDVLARHLAAQGFVVIAPDLRGYGQWLKEGDCKKSLDYNKSYQDLVNISQALKDEYPHLPLYVIGESLGADLALRMGSQTQNLVDGLILSSPALKRRAFYGAILSHSGKLLTRPQREVDVSPYIGRYISEDPLVVEETLHDPLVRKKVNAFDLLKTISCLRSGLHYAKSIPKTMPILIMQGNKDRIVRSNAVMLLLARLKSSDQTVRWFSNRGHLLLETSYVQPDTLLIVEGWLKEHIANQTIMQANNPENKYSLPNSADTTTVVQAAY